MDSRLRAVATNDALSAYKTLLVGVDGPTAHGELSLENIQCALEQSNFTGQLSATYRLDNVVEECEVFKPELILAVASSFSAQLLPKLSECQCKVQCALILLTNDNSRLAIESAAAAGVNSYLTHVPPHPQLLVAMDAAMARFKLMCSLRSELEASKTLLSERKLIERAKGILMQRKALDEQSAYRAMQKMAMDRNLRLADLASTIISAAEILD